MITINYVSRGTELILMANPNHITVVALDGILTDVIKHKYDGECVLWGNL